MLKMPDPFGYRHADSVNAAFLHHIKECAEGCPHCTPLFTADQLKAAYRQAIEDAASKCREQWGIDGQFTADEFAECVLRLLDDTDARKGE